MKQTLTLTALAVLALASLPAFATGDGSAVNTGDTVYIFHPAMNKPLDTLKSPTAKPMPPMAVTKDIMPSRFDPNTVFGPHNKG